MSWSLWDELAHIPVPWLNSSHLVILPLDSPSVGFLLVLVAGEEALPSLCWAPAPAAASHLDGQAVSSLTTV